MKAVNLWTTTALAVLGLGLAAPAMSQTVAEEFIYYPSQSDEFFFFEATDRKKVADFKTDKMVRVCVDNSDHLVPLKVTYDSESTEVSPGDCFRFEAKEVILEPAKELDRMWVVKADVDVMQTRS